MERRTFLKVIGALVGSAAVPSAATMIIEATLPLPAGAAHLGLIREICAYDIYRDEALVRYDILAADQQLQLSVDCRLQDTRDKSKLEECREAARVLLEAELDKRGLTWADITPLPLPQWYTAPKWQASWSA